MKLHHWLGAEGGPAVDAFKPCLAAVLKHEGGFVDHPKL